MNVDTMRSTSSDLSHPTGSRLFVLYGSHCTQIFVFATLQPKKSLASGSRYSSVMLCFDGISDGIGWFENGECPYLCGLQGMIRLPLSPRIEM